MTLMRKTALCKCENKGLTNIRATIWAYTWVSEKFGHFQMPKLRKRAIHILSLLKKKGGGYTLAALKKGSIQAHIHTMSILNLVFLNSKEAL